LSSPRGLIAFHGFSLIFFFFCTSLRFFPDLFSSVETRERDRRPSRQFIVLAPFDHPCRSLGVTCPSPRHEAWLSSASRSPPFFFPLSLRLFHPPLFPSSGLSLPPTPFGNLLSSSPFVSLIALFFLLLSSDRPLSETYVALSFTIR